MSRTRSSAANPPTGRGEMRLDVRSPDGTVLAVWAVDGPHGGPAIVLVHGSLQDHSVNAAFTTALQADCATYAMDRRGSGASHDGGQYAVEREFEDVAAVVDAVAARAGAPVALLGHSFGASCALGGAALTSSVSHLILYEPSLGLAYPPGWVERCEAMIAEGNPEGAVVAMYRDLLGFTPERLADLRASDTWAQRIGAIGTLVREARVESGWTYEPGQFDGVSAPTLLLSGSKSTPEVQRATQQAAAAVPGARIHRLDGHDHFAHRTHPAMVAAVVRDFVAS